MFDTVINYVFMFFAFSAVGWTVESTYRSLGERRIINSGFLHGPMCPIYGTGALVFHLCLVPLSQPVEKRVWLVILLGMVLADTVEYITSFLMEKLFHARWWDYSGNFLNLNGRICFKHTLYWGLASFIYVYLVAPVYDFILGFIPQETRTVAVFVILAVFLLDLVLTVKAAVNIQKVMSKLDSLRLTMAFAAEAVKVKAENLKDSAETRYENFYSSVTASAEKFNAWKSDINAQFNEAKKQFEQLNNGQKTKNSSRGTKRLLTTFSTLKKEADKDIKDFEKAWEDFKAKFKDDEMM